LILGVGNLFIGVVEGYDSSSGKLPLSPVFQGNIATKDAMNASIGILVGVMRVLVVFLFGLVLLIKPLFIPTIILVTVFVAIALPFAGGPSGRWTSDPCNPPLYGKSLDELGKDPKGPWNMHPPSCAWALA
jgi:hypothetical protein